ncbi:MAG: hypothetical protein ACXAC8_09725 [Candidatus Hodarchaeales archaeon]|jgi:hypothetical protein
MFHIEENISRGNLSIPLFILCVKHQVTILLTSFYLSEPMEINPIALSAATSAFMAFIAAVTLIYDWYATGKGELPRLEWGIGMVAYGTGNLIAAFIYSFNELTDISFFVNISFSGAVSMSFLLYGTLILLNSNQIRSRLIAIGYGFIFIVSMGSYSLLVLS